MNLDPRQTELIQTPVGRGLAALLNGGEPSGGASLDESADRLAVAQPQGLKGTSRLGDTQVARVEKLQDGKLPGLSQFKGLSAKCDAASKPATWRDNLTVPEPPPNSVRKLAVGISGGVVAGVLACVLAMNYIRNSTAERSPEPIPSGHEVSQTVTTAVVKVQEKVETKSAGEAGEDRTDRSVFMAPDARDASPGESPAATRLKSRLDPEVLFRLELSLEQAARIRTILDRCSKDLPFAEAQIRGLLTAEQNRRWQSITP